MASHYIYQGLGSAIVERENQFGFWDKDQNCAFDVFNQVKPDVFIGQGYNLDRSIIKCLNNNKDIKVVLKVGIDSKEFLSEYDKEKYPILIATDQEKNLVDQIENKDRIVLFNYCHENRKDYVIGGWKELGYKIWGFLPAVDTNVYYQVPINKELLSDIVFIGGYWEYKAQNLDKYIVPLCYPIGKYKIKIFGNQHWSVPQYLGFASDENIRNLICSSTICPNIHEPHSNKYGFDVVPRIFNIIACKGFCISDYVESLEKDIFTNNELLMVKDPQDFFGLIDYFLKNPEKREEYINKAYSVVMRKHTYKNRVSELMDYIEK
jgi:hypothetical protein